MRPYLNIDAAHKIYEMVIVPIILYNTFLDAQPTSKLSLLEKRAKAMIVGNRKLRSIEGKMKMRISKLVKWCLNGDVCSNLENYFEINSYEKNTRNINRFLKLPEVKLEFARNSFKFQGARIYNLSLIHI